MTLLLKDRFFSKISWLTNSINNHNRMWSSIFCCLTGKEPRIKGGKVSFQIQHLIDKKCSLYRCFTPEWRKKRFLENKILGVPTAISIISTRRHQQLMSFPYGCILPRGWPGWDSQCWVLHEHRVPRNVRPFKQLF